jgi:hypothetical protein
MYGHGDPRVAKQPDIAKVNLPGLELGDAVSGWLSCTRLRYVGVDGLCVQRQAHGHRHAHEKPKRRPCFQQVFVRSPLSTQPLFVSRVGFAFPAPMFRHVLVASARADRAVVWTSPDSYYGLSTPSRCAEASMVPAATPYARCPIAPRRWLSIG